MNNPPSLCLSYRLKKLLKAIFTLCIIFLFCALSGCSKKSSVQESPKNLRLALSKDTQSFYIFDGSRFNESPLSIQDVLEAVKKLEVKDSQEVQAIKNHGIEILSALPTTRIAELIKGAALFSNQSVLSVCLQTTSPKTSELLAARLLPLQESKGFIVKTQKNLDRLSISLPLAKDRLAASESSSIDTCLSKEDAGYTIAPSLFVEFEKDTTFAIGQFILGNDVSFSQMTGPVTGTISTEDIPIKDFQVIQSLDKTYNLKVIAPLQTTSAEQNRLIETLNTPNVLHSTAFSFPGALDTAAFAVKLNRNFLDAILIAAIAESNNEQADIAKTLQRALTEVSAATLSVLQGSDDAIFPDLVLSLSTPSTETLHETLKTEVQKLVSSQVPMSNWFEKETGGVHFNYVQSPLGIGIYLAKANDKVLIATSENGIIKSANSSSKQLDEELLSRGFPAPEAPEFVALFGNAPRLASLVESVQSILSMFTGGQSTLNNEELVRLKSLSIGKLSFSLKERTLIVNFDFIPKTTPQKP